MADVREALKNARDYIGRNGFGHDQEERLRELDGAIGDLDAARSQDFAEWLAREMPAGTVIGDPHWWANLIARRFAQFAATQAPPAAADGEARALARCADGIAKLGERAERALLQSPPAAAGPIVGWRDSSGVLHNDKPAAEWKPRPLTYADVPTLAVPADHPALAAAREASDLPLIYHRRVNEFIENAQAKAGALDDLLAVIDSAQQAQQPAAAVPVPASHIDAQIERARSFVPEGYRVVPVEPPFPKKWIAKGVRVVNGKAVTVWLRYTDEGGGWYQWDTSRSGAKLFDSAEAAIKAARGCPGPHFHMPAKGSIAAEEVESPKATQYRAMLAAAERKGE